MTRRPASESGGLAGQGGDHAVFKSGMTAVNSIPEGSRDALRPRSARSVTLPERASSRADVDKVAPVTREPEPSGASRDRGVAVGNLQERLAQIRLMTAEVAQRADFWEAALDVERRGAMEVEQASSGGRRVTALGSLLERVRHRLRE